MFLDASLSYCTNENTYKFPALSPEFLCKYQKVKTTVKRMQRKRGKTAILASSYQKELVEAIKRTNGVKEAGKNKVKKSYIFRKRRKEDRRCLFQKSKRRKLVNHMRSPSKEQMLYVYILMTNIQLHMMIDFMPSVLKSGLTILLGRKSVTKSLYRPVNYVSPITAR